jgi:hypothetical protein
MAVRGRGGALRGGRPGAPDAATARCALALAALAALLPAARAGAPTMWMQPLVDIDPLAVCNDGSPASYYFIEGTTQANVWLIYLEGGMWCAGSCTPRRQKRSMWRLRRDARRRA